MLKIAVDIEDISEVSNKNKGKDKDRELIAVYEKYEDPEELLEIAKKYKIRVSDYRYVTYVDINTTKYNIPCAKRCQITDKLELDSDELNGKNKDHKFGIIVPNYNNDHGDYKGKTFLRSCLDSIVGQTYKNWELCFIDDMSTDTSVETVKSYNDDRITIIKNERKRWNGGSRNVGIDYFKNKDIDYFCFLDSDDWWKDNEVLDTIDKNLYDYENNCEYEMLVISPEMIHPPDGGNPKIHSRQMIQYWNNYQDFFVSENLWCTAWCRVIKKEKIVYFPECTVMEDRTWSYEQADNIDFDKVKNLQKIMYVWNRMNTKRSVTLVRDGNWNASAYKHIGECLMVMERLRHREMVPAIRARTDECIAKLRRGVYTQY